MKINSQHIQPSQSKPRDIKNQRERIRDMIKEHRRKERAREVGTKAIITEKMMENIRKQQEGANQEEFRILTLPSKYQKTIVGEID